MSKAKSTGQQVIPIIISSYGGSVYAALEMIDIMKSIGVPTVTVCMGKCMSAGVVLFAAGDRRYASPNATIMIHEVSSRMGGKNNEIKFTAREVDRLNKILFKVIGKSMGKTGEFVRDMIHNIGHADLYLTPIEAKKLGLVHEVKVPKIIIKGVVFVEVK
jgi:ATP-dependent Clp protease protease subunit